MTIKKHDSNDNISKQYWRDVSESERSNWQNDEAESVYAWVREHLAEGANKVLININVQVSGSVVTVISRDCSFIIDSLTALVQRRGFAIAGLVHPVIEDAQLARPVSVVSIRLKESLTDHEAEILRREIELVMEDVILATRDWEAMREKMRTLIASVQNQKDIDAEEIAFLQYLCANNFTFLGYTSTIAKTFQPKDGMGVLSGERSQPLLNSATIPLPTVLHEKSNAALTVFKLPIISTVHRPVRFDTVVIREKDAKGNVVGEHVFIGLFTSVTYSRSIQDVPLLRRKAQQVIESSGVASDHHDYKATAHILEKYPRDELFRIDLSTLKDFVKGIMRLQERQRIALFARPDHLTKSISVLVYIPRERYETRLRKQIQDILEREYAAVSEGFTVSLDDSPLVRVLFTLRAIKDDALLADAAKVEEHLIEETRSWQDRVRNILPRELAVKYTEAFSVGYQDHYGTENLITDGAHIEKLLETKELQLELYRPAGMPDNQVRFKIYALNEAVALSNVLPILENFGFHVQSEQPFDLYVESQDATIWMHDFYLCAQDANTSYDIEKLRPVFEESFAAIWRNAAANDGLNRLTTRAAMPVRQVMMLRAYARYLHQIRVGYSPSYVIATLGDYPKIAELLVNLFEHRFDPSMDLNEREDKLVSLRAGITEQLAQVASLDQDTILRRLHNLIESTMRTNAYQRDAHGAFKDYISFKIDCSLVTSMPDPRPMYEVFVFSARMEGVHLRFGKVARGGIRWSDRSDDFRTEVLGLVKAQKVKNAVIVPTGAKGGFILKNPPPASDRKAFAEEGIACYRLLIKGLLDITDNLKGDDAVRPAHAICYDEEDPYLVVAADKGTASFSDIANGISADYGFWLGDAFASGGSVGYDHKVMGITAKGAWECVKRHFREIGKNIQQEEFTVIGVGDMGGDVFGNGMLLSPHTKLIGAFNHRHIFCDPEPNAAKSFAERQRLFNEVAGWEQYKEAVLSKGGKIFERSSKSLKLTKEIKDAFGLTVDEITPDDLIRAMLTTPVELLYFGGIGTYIKDETESDADVADRANDRLRVNATQVRARVLGEGANLAVTQLARITMDQIGVHLNTDFIDNSAGVDCSDHEVNIKILFNQIMQREGLSMEDRNVMLKDMTDAVSALVLRDNYQQSQAISQIKLQGAGLLPQLSMTIGRLVSDYGLMIKVEQLPNIKALQDRQAKGQGLTRPEIAIVVSHAKMALKKELLLTDILDREDVTIWLRTYFPEALQKRYLEAILAHPLRREIIATQMANSIVNRMGPHFLFEKQEQSGLSVASIVDAYLLGRDILNLNALWNSIEQLDNQIDSLVQMRLMEKTTRTLDRLIRRFLSLHGERLRLLVSAPRLREQMLSIQPNLVGMLTGDLAAHYQQRMSQLKDQNVAKGIAEAVTLLPYTVMAIEAMQLNGKDDGGEMAIKTYFAVGERFQIELLRQQARLLAADFPENARAISSLMDSLMTAQSGATLQILHAPGNDAQSRLISWIAAHQESINAVDWLLQALVEGHMLDLGRLVLIEQKLRQLAQRA